jgi:hypothetical protein
MGDSATDNSIAGSWRIVSSAESNIGLRFAILNLVFLLLHRTTSLMLKAKE